LADNGKTVIVASLIGNYLLEGFGDILNLLPHCEKITMLSAICMRCHARDASFTALKREDVERDGQPFVGGSESYEAVCRQCFNTN